MCNRSEKPFPNSQIDIIGFLKRAWHAGWLNEYSDEHFLIKCINDKLTGIEWEIQLLSNNANSLYSPIMSNGEIDYHIFSTNFIINLSAKLKCMSDKFGEEKIKQFIENQLSAGKASYDIDMFFQALSEIEILSFYCGKADWDEVIYEPPIGINGANPEARFVIVDKNNITTTFNIEVKTPKFPSISQQTSGIAIPTILLSNVGRENFHKLCKENNINCIMPRVTKLVEFINSAAKKFKKPNENEFNLLYINWSYSDFPSNSFLEPWSLLTNEKNGILTHPEIGTKLQFKQSICSDAYEKISAVIVYTSSLDQLMFSNFLHSWQGSSQVGPRFRMFVLDQELRKKELSNESNVLFNITGMKPSILEPEKWRILIDFNLSNCSSTDKHKFLINSQNIITTNFLTL